MTHKGSVRTRLAACFIAAVLLPALAAAQEPEPTSGAHGQVLFQDRCASCHGTDATGNGPAASSLSQPPPDLTEISKRAGGAFPAPRVVEIITYGGNIAAHGTGPMPVWGKVFSDEGGRGKIGAATSRQSVIALKRYLETIQK
jgi:mono/diheme cytochrome c family protein